jgi:hypothetical protein
MAHAADLSGLYAVGLSPSTHKRNQADAAYFTGGQPKICVYSYSADFTFLQPAGVRRGVLQRSLEHELRYGMKIQVHRGRFLCIWTPEELREFVMWHVIPHEIGHHVYRKLKQVDANCFKSSEQYAEEYAVQFALTRSKLPVKRKQD